MINIEDIIHQLTANAEAMRALVQTIPDEQAQWMPDPETWPMKRVMEHVYNEERLDFRKHLIEMLTDIPMPWSEYRYEECISVESCHQALEGFLIERKASIAWLMGLKSPDWDVTSRTPFGPSGGVLVLSAGDMLVSWVAHDILHLRQMIELKYSWNEKLAPPYSLQYAGGW